MHWFFLVQVFEPTGSAVVNTAVNTGWGFGALVI